MAPKVGARLGKCAVLFRAMPPGKKGVTVFNGAQKLCGGDQLDFVENQKGPFRRVLVADRKLLSYIVHNF